MVWYFEKTTLLSSVVMMWLLLMAGSVRATTGDMEKLPVSQPNLCSSCHLTGSPTIGDSGLNPFGADFLENGRVWDSNLALEDSDQDGCTNGVEIGDSDGDGEADGNVVVQSGNPGVAGDCGSGSLVEEQTWSTLKAMFDARR